MRARSSAEATWGRRPRPSGSRSARRRRVVVAARAGRLGHELELAGARLQLDNRLFEVAEVEGVFRVKAPRRDQPEMRFLDWDEVESSPRTPSRRYGNLVLLAALTGLRQGELFALRDRNVDLEAITLQVEHGPTEASSCP